MLALHALEECKAHGLQKRVLKVSLPADDYEDYRPMGRNNLQKELVYFDKVKHRY